jgi:hypothetical protein
MAEAGARAARVTVPRHRDARRLLEAVKLARDRLSARALTRQWSAPDVPLGSNQPNDRVSALRRDAGIAGADAVAETKSARRATTFFSCRGGSCCATSSSWPTSRRRRIPTPRLGAQVHQGQGAMTTDIGLAIQAAIARGEAHRAPCQRQIRVRLFNYPQGLTIVVTVPRARQRQARCAERRDTGSDLSRRAHELSWRTARRSSALRPLTRIAR